MNFKVLVGLYNWRSRKNFVIDRCTGTKRRVYKDEPGRERELWKVEDGPTI